MHKHRSLQWHAHLPTKTVPSSIIPDFRTLFFNYGPLAASSAAPTPCKSLSAGVVPVLPLETLATTGITALSTWFRQRVLFSWRQRRAKSTLATEITHTLTPATIENNPPSPTATWIGTAAEMAIAATANANAIAAAPAAAAADCFEAAESEWCRIQGRSRASDMRSHRLCMHRNLARTLLGQSQSVCAPPE